MNEFVAKVFTLKVEQKNQTLKHLHADSKIADIGSWTPFETSNFPLKFPPFDFTTNAYLPKTDNTIFISTNNPTPIGTDTDTPSASLEVHKS